MQHIYFLKILLATFQLRMKFKLLENSIKIPLMYLVDRTKMHVQKKNECRHTRMRIKSIETTDPYYHRIFSTDYGNGIMSFIYLMLGLLPV